MSKIIGIIILTAFTFWVMINIVSCRTTKDVSKKIDQAFHSAKIDSSGGAKVIVSNVKTDSSKFNSEITIDFDSLRARHALMDGADTSLFTLMAPDNTGDVYFYAPPIKTTQPIKRITIKTNAQIATSSVFGSSKIDSAKKVSVLEDDTKEVAYHKTVKHISFYWYIIAFFFIALVLYFLYRKYKPSILSLIKKIPL